MDPLEIMVLISNPSDLPSWPRPQKEDRYQRVLQWHDYIARLHDQNLVPQIWGSHQLLSRPRFSTSLGLLVAVYRVDSWAHFDDLLAEDPLRDVSQYATIPLSPLREDQRADQAKFEDLREQLAHEDPVGQLTWSVYRSLFKKAPDYVGKYEYRSPANPPTDIGATEQPGQPLQILIIGMNPDEVVTQWDDTRKLIHYLKVTWWHDYTAMLLDRGKLTHVWGTHDFCYIGGLSATYAGAVSIYSVDSYDEFDDLYRLDPIRDATLFWSVLLQPIADQRRLDQKRVGAASPGTPSRRGGAARR